MSHLGSDVLVMGAGGAGIAISGLATPSGGERQVLAESEGFEPPSPCGLTVFKTAAFDRSANSPAGDFTRAGTRASKLGLKILFGARILVPTRMPNA